MTADERINTWLAPVADWFGKVIFFSVPVAGAQLPLIMAWLIVGGVVCTLAFRFVNLRGFRHSLRVIRGDYSSKDHPGEATPFQALSTAVSGTVGLGSIGGVAIAVTLGGPGAAFWMVIAGFLGMSTKFAEVTLAVKHRVTRPDGSVSGGAMYYVPIALQKVGMPRLGKFLAAVFCVAAVGGSLTIFQVNQAWVQFHAVTGYEQGIVFGLITAAWVAFVLFGGVKRIVQWTDKLSPFMCLLYVAACVVVLGGGSLIAEQAIRRSIAAGALSAASNAGKATEFRKPSVNVLRMRTRPLASAEEISPLCSAGERRSRRPASVARWSSPRSNLPTVGCSLRRRAQKSARR